MKHNFLLILFLILFPLIHSYAQIYKDTKAPVDERVCDLLGRMTLSEKLSYIGGYNSFYIEPVSRLGIPAIKMSDGPVGVRNYGNTTAYPAGVLMAASWDTALIHNEGIGLGLDARARGVHILLGPGMNIYRIPINGRNFEYFGEDPFLASEMAVSYIKGLQSQGVMATAKHFAVNSFERNRGSVSAEVDERTLEEIYFPAFKACAERAEVGAFMSAYNKINNTWCSENDYLLNQTLKGKWNFNGFVMSDWGATHHALPSAKGGLDLEMPSGSYMNSTNLMTYINNGSLDESVIDDKVRRILFQLFRFGFFDRSQTRSDIPQDNPVTGEIALNGARGGIVLLKNNSILPLSTDTVHSIAVVGDFANSYVAGGGSSYTSPNHYTSVYQGLQDLIGDSVDVQFSAATPGMDSAYQNSLFYVDSMGLQSGLKSSWFDNKSLSGSPVDSSVDQYVNNYWTDAPGIPGIGADNFSVRWSGYILPETAGEYNFSVASDDGFRLYINDTLFMSDWSDHATVIVNKTAYLDTSVKYHIVLEYYENGGIAEIRMGYQNTDSLTNSGVQLAANSDVAIVCVGFGSNNESEGSDRTFDLPQGQDDFINAVAGVNENTIVILFAGGAVQTSPWLNHIKGFIHAFYPGEYGGEALAEIIMGKVNPSGKLPFSFDREWKNNPAYDDYNAAGAYDATKYSEGLYVGYRFYDTATSVSSLFPFGYGQSFTSFKYSNLKITPDDPTNFKQLLVQFDITNTGHREGKEIPQLYIHDVNPSDARPFKELKAFDKIDLQPAETKTVSFNLGLDAFKYYKTSIGEWDFDPGDFEIMIGSSSVDIRLHDTFTLTTDMVLPETIRVYPPDNEYFVNIKPTFSITFSREMSCDGTSFSLKRYSDDKLMDTFTPDDLTGLGTRTITFNPHVNLDYLTEYYVEMPAGFFTDGLGKSFKGFTNKDTWNFKTTAEVTEAVEDKSGSSDVLIYPNPSEGEIFIKWPGEFGRAVVTFYDMTGKSIYSEQKGRSDESLKVNVSGLAPGIYIVQIIGDKQNTTQKVIIH